MIVIVTEHLGKQNKKVHITMDLLYIVVQEWFSKTCIHNESAIEYRVPKWWREMYFNLVIIFRKNFQKYKIWWHFDKNRPKICWDMSVELRKISIHFLYFYFLFEQEHQLEKIYGNICIFNGSYLSRLLLNLHQLFAMINIIFSSTFWQ